MFNYNLCISFSDYFTEFAHVKIRTTEMTNIRFNWSVGFDSSKPTPGTMFRPKSSRYESRKMSIKHRNSVDSLDNSTDQLLHKRSNSLQSLNSIDNQSNIEERAKLAAKPRKIAWASRTCSEEKSVEPIETWNPCEIFDHVEPCIEQKRKLEESKKKSIDIFLSSNFINPTDILPSYRHPKLSLLKSFGSSSFNAAVDKHEPDSSDDFFVKDEEEKALADEPIATDIKNEKKVTFAADLGKPMNAETRRLNFRNSYSKRYTTNFSFSSSRLERQTSVSKCPITKDELASTTKRGNSSNLAENSDESTTLVTCRSASPSLLFKQPVQPINLQQTDKMKQLTIKRKLKSCRSRSFHKSLDNSSVIENFDTFSFAKPSKSVQNSDVVTMVSLIVSNEEDTDPAPHARQPVIKADSAVSVKENIEIKSGKQTKTGILKSKWPSDNVKRVNNQPIQKRRFINVSHKQINSPEKNRTILSVVNNFSKTENEPSDVTNSSTSSYSEENFVEVESKETESDKPFQSAKEQECWSSFRKMTNKGFSVSFDTILRGLLTPTEYRLRKGELLTQQS